ncbi:unnamed protein product [Ectocarpus sp. 4 AP-2014]
MGVFRVAAGVLSPSWQGEEFKKKRNPETHKNVCTRTGAHTRRRALQLSEAIFWCRCLRIFELMSCSTPTNDGRVTPSFNRFEDISVELTFRLVCSAPKHHTKRCNRMHTATSTTL